MRFITGLILGVALTIGVAYVVDASHGETDGKAALRMVNWEVVNSNVQSLSSGARNVWAGIVGGAKKLDKEVDRPS